MKQHIIILSVNQLTRMKIIYVYPIKQIWKIYKTHFHTTTFIQRKIVKHPDTYNNKFLKICYRHEHD